MKNANAKIILVLAICAIASAATATTMVDYGWEDSGTELGIYPDPAFPSIIVTNVAGWDGDQITVAGNTGLVLEARTYSNPGDIVWIDDLHIEMPDHVYVQIPGCSPVGVESETWGGVKALFR